MIVMVINLNTETQFQYGVGMDIKKIIKVNELIASGRSGTPRYMADKLGISERMVFHIIKFMKDELHAPIKYDRNKMRYYFDGHGSLNFTWHP
jgi:hypothetical protein